MNYIFTKDININYLNKLITINGWVNNFRILKNYIFIILRDREGIIQIFIDNNNITLFNLAKKIRLEFCIKVTGIVKKKLNFFEIKAKKIIIINNSLKLPFDFNKTNSDIIRLKYRYLDIRSRFMTINLKYKSNILFFLRNYLYKNKFIEVDTPILSNPNSEGARDFLIPSRIHKGNYFALPQSPQLYKQLLMISGLYRYFQIAKCFRDEDLRSDRQPEFLQLDLEVSFLNSIQIRNIIELMIKKLWLKFKKKIIPTFNVLSYNECLEKYATDKPDLRNPLYFINIDKLFNNEDKNINNIIIIIKNNNLLNETHLKYYKKLFFNNNINIFGWIIIIDIFNNKIKISSDLKISKNKIKFIIKKFKIKNNDIIFFISYDNKNNNNYLLLNKFRFLLAKKLKIINYDTDNFVWIINFPLFKKNKEGILISNHHPFTAPLNKYTKEEIINNPLNILADDYDLVINGYEIGSGSIRNNFYKIQKIIFNILGLNKEEQKKQFGYLLKALKFGAPNHGGIALGIERLLMILLKLKNIKDIIAFPKSTNLSCLLTNSPIYINKKYINKLY